ncbi:MAG TPA: DNA polymerase IV [Conexivisphaerales archaeon]|nr:DNA polymerase IV [Conexivisphaerales archaeon]
MSGGPPPKPARVIAAVDMDYFYAQCEELRNPSLRSKPVVICMFSGRTEDSGAVATCNYVARGYGVRSGIPIFRAKELLKDVEAFFLPPDFKYYDEVSGRVMEVLEDVSDRMSPESIDEAYLDVSSKTGGDYDAAAKLALKMKEAVLKDVGLTCSVGVGPNKLVAKMASDKSKPNGLLVVREGEFLDQFGSMPVDKLYGVGKKTADRLEKLGAKTIADLSRLPLEELQKEFGRKLGLYFFLASKGTDDQPLSDWKREQVGRMVTLKEDTRDVAAIVGPLAAMATEIADELAEARLSYKSVGVVVIDNAILKAHSRSRSLKSEERGVDAIVKVARELLAELFEEEPDLVARRLSVRVSSLRSTAGQTELSSFY